MVDKNANNKTSSPRQQDNNEFFTPDDPELVERVNALIEYSAEQGLLGTDQQSGSPTSGQKLLDELGEAVCAYREAAPGEDRYKKRLKLLQLYAQLNKLTGKVNGRSLIDTRHVSRHLLPLIVYTAVFLIVVLVNEGFSLLILDMVEPEDGWARWFVDFQRYFLDYASPFFWGGLGACVFLLKTLSDKAQEKRFDRRLLQGWQTRIWLGAILGTIVCYIYDPENFTEGSLNLDANAVAFLTGVGVKVVYGAIEKTVEQLTQRFNLDVVRKPDADVSRVRAYLETKLAETAEDETDKRQVLLELIDETSRPPKP